MILPVFVVMAAGIEWFFGDVGDGVGAGLDDATLDQPYLVDVREREISRCGQDPDGAGGGPAVASVDVPGGDGGASGQGNASRAANSPGLLPVTVSEVRSALVEVVGVGVLGVWCVRSDHRVGQVDTGLFEAIEQGANIGIS